MSLYNQDIQGNQSVSRNLHVGGNSDVKGDVRIGHNLIVKGWVDAPNIKGALKGLYKDEASLNEAYPRPMPGWFALVGDTLPANVYRVDGDKWVKTGQKGGEFSIYLDQLEKDYARLDEEVKDLQELTEGGILLKEKITFTSTANTAQMELTFLMPDGTQKPFKYPIPIVSDTAAGMMTAADKKTLGEHSTQIEKINTRLQKLEETTQQLGEKVDKNTSDISKLRQDFEDLVGKNASEAIDNFREILAFLDGIKDTETLVGKIAEIKKDCDDKNSSGWRYFGIADDSEDFLNTISIQDGIKPFFIVAKAGLYIAFDKPDGIEVSEEEIPCILRRIDGKWKKESLGVGEALAIEKKERKDADSKHDSDILELQNTVFPLELTFTAQPLLIEVGVQTQLILSWEARRKGADVTEKCELALNSQRVTGKGKTEVINEARAIKLPYALAASYEGLTESKVLTVQVVNGTYFGSVSHDWQPSEATIKALGKSLKANREATYTGISTNNGKICYCYPASYGILTSVKDGNGYEVLASYTMSTVSIDGISYYCYLLTVPVTSSGVTQIYK